MAEGKVTFLTEVDLPPYCFMSEAVEWIAFGRVPQMQHYFDDETDESVDYRFYWGSMPDNFQPELEYPWLKVIPRRQKNVSMKAPDFCLAG